MKFILTAGWEDGVAALSERLVRELTDGRKVLWLLCGGSNIPASVQVMDNLSSKLRQNLSVMLTDERYGSVGHADSNWTQLLEAGFKTEGITTLAVLQKGLSLEQTASRYSQLATQAFSDNEIILAQLGIGADGHLAGILPGSPAAHADKDLATGYNGEPFTRLTLTFPALRRINTAYAFAFGETKRQALQKLRDQSLPLDKQPAQLLKELPEAYLYNDQVGGNRS